MDNADEVNPIDSNLTHKEVALFLGDELKSQNNESVVTYNLVEEYAKTAKQKKPFVWILLAVCFFIVTVGTITTIALVSTSNHKIAINIDSFDDLNLRSLLSSAGRVKTSYENAVKNKKTLEQNLSDELNQAEQKRKMDLFTLESVSTVATKKSISERKNKIEAEYNVAVQKIHKEYDEKIAKAEADIKKFQSQVSSYDSDKLSRAKDAESSIDSTKQLHDMEMKSQEERYEKKISELRSQLLAQQIKAAEDQRKAVEEVRDIYQAKINLLDPKAREESNEQNKIILDTGIQNQLASSALWKSVENLSFNEESYTTIAPDSSFSEAVRNSNKELTELRTIAYRFKPIPMENSIKDYVPAMMHQSYRIATSLAESGAKIQSDLNAFETIAEQSLINGTDGIILSTSKAPEFSVYVANASKYKINQDTELPVQILNGSKHVADGTIANVNGDYIVKQILPQTKEGSPAPQYYHPVPGDRIRIVLQTK
ncbi:hypothetical protein [Treponema sp. UBA3813]|uniref:hypothetical protein n=1 Tax=Treponema sp. UBA3813 TaxID=1947715 RepID=UPI0025CC15EE|nr:hypothetical protein [Treponema sp. UBA3813]